MRFICADGDDDVAQSRVGCELPVFDGNLWRRNILVCAVVNAGQIFGVAVNRFFLEISYDTMGSKNSYRKCLVQSKPESARTRMAALYG